MKAKYDFLLAGVGGQGTISAGDILAAVGLRAGLEVKKSEVHGMSQRGGAVETHVRWGRRVFSPLIERGEADFLLGFELLEAVRWVGFMHPEGTVLVSRHQQPPLAVATGQMVYPDEGALEQALRRAARQVFLIDAMNLARELGHAAISGMVLLGGLSGLLPVEPRCWLEVIEERVPVRFLEANRQAFNAGRGITADKAG